MSRFSRRVLDRAWDLRNRILEAVARQDVATARRLLDELFREFEGN
jgi:hypothetical protein